MGKKYNDKLIQSIEKMFGVDSSIKSNMAQGQIHRVYKILGVDACSVQKTEDEAIAKETVQDYGTAKSGNWGHKGRIGKRGGSAKGTGSKAYRGEGKQYNTGQQTAEKYYGNRKEWANGLKGDKGHRADKLIADYAKRFDEALANGKIVMKKANTMKFDTPEAQQAYLSTLTPEQQADYHKNNKVADPKKMTPTQKAAYAVSFAEKGSAGATSYKEKAQFVELMGEAKHWKQYKDKYISENLTKSQAQAMKKIEEAYGGDEEAITGTWYEGKFYPGDAPKGVAAAYTALKCKAMTERTTPINYHYQGGSDILGVLDPTKAAKSVQNMSQEQMDKMNALLEPAIKKLGTDSDGYPPAYKLTSMSAPGMVDRSQGALLNAVDAKGVPLKNVRQYLQMKGAGTSYQADVKSVMDAIASGEDLSKSKNALVKRMRKLDKDNGIPALTALANIVKKYDNGKFTTDVNAFEEHLAYKATPQEQMAYLRAKAAILSDKQQAGSASLYGYGDQSSKAYDFSKYNSGDWTDWHGQGVPVKPEQSSNPETQKPQSQNPKGVPPDGQSKSGDGTQHSTKAGELASVASKGSVKDVKDWINDDANVKPGDSFYILNNKGQKKQYFKQQDGIYQCDDGQISSTQMAHMIVLNQMNGGNYELKQGANNGSKQKNGQEEPIVPKHSKNKATGVTLGGGTDVAKMKQTDMAQIGTLGGVNNHDAKSKLQGTTINTDPKSKYKSPISDQQPSGFKIVHSYEQSKDHFCGQEGYNEWAYGLTGKQKQGLSAYQDGTYSDINSTLGSGLGFDSLTQWQKGVTKGMDSAIAKYDLKQDTVVYRGFRVKHLLGYFEKQLNMSNGTINPVELIGRVWNNEAFMSSSGSHEQNWGAKDDYRDQLILCVPKGKGRGCYIDGVSGLSHMHEDQFIVKRNSKLMINDVKWQKSVTTGKYKWHVYATMVCDD